MINPTSAPIMSLHWGEVKSLVHTEYSEDDKGEILSANIDMHLILE